MQAISPALIAHQANSTPEEPKTLIFGLTSAKVEQIAYGFFAALTFIAAATLLTMALVSNAIVPTFLALPLLTAAGLAVWKVISIKDYDDPEQLAKFQKEAESATLLETFEKHGAKNMVRYGIPHPDHFPDFNDQSMSLTEAIKLHEELHRTYLELDSEAVKLFTGIEDEKATYLASKWTETRSKCISICKLFETDFDIELLNTHGLLTSKEYKALKTAKQKYDNAHVEFQKDLAKLDNSREQKERKEQFHQLLFIYHQEYTQELSDEE